MHRKCISFPVRVIAVQFANVIPTLTAGGSPCTACAGYSAGHQRGHLEDVHDFTPHTISDGVCNTSGPELRVWLLIRQHLYPASPFGSMSGAAGLQKMQMYSGGFPDHVRETEETRSVRDHVTRLGSVENFPDVRVPNLEGQEDCTGKFQVCNRPPYRRAA